MRKPNVVLFMADQMTAFALSAYGNKTIKAPNIAALAERGVTFQNAYCNSPICGPSRACMLTGKLPSSIGVFDNAAEWPASVPTLNHYLRTLKYHTVLSGKMHFVGPDQLHGYNERLTTDIYPSDFAWVSDWRGGPRNAPTGINMRAVVEAGPCIRSLQIDYDEETSFMANQKLYDLARNADETPFFLTISLTHPHSPFTAAQQYWDRYDHDSIDMPSTGPLPIDDLDTHSRWLYYSHGRDRLDVTDAHVRNARHAYYGMVSYVDDKVGACIQVLRETNLLDDTIVIFTSDHGEMLGERGMWYKQTFFENSVRVPLIMSGPGLPRGRSVEKNVSLADLMPTILTMAGDGKVELASPLAGADLSNLIAGSDKDWSDRVISEYLDMGVCAPCRMVREGRYKYMYTHGHASLLFDVKADPAERQNLAGRPEVADIEDRLRQSVLAGWDPNLIMARVLESQAMRRVINDAVGADERRDNWAFEFRRGDKARYVRGSGAGTGTNAVKGRARFPFVEPTVEREPPPVPEAYRS